MNNFLLFYFSLFSFTFTIHAADRQNFVEREGGSYINKRIFTEFGIFELSIPADNSVIEPKEIITILGNALKAKGHAISLSHVQLFVYGTKLDVESPSFETSLLLEPYDLRARLVKHSENINKAASVGLNSDSATRNQRTVKKPFIVMGHKSVEIEIALDRCFMVSPKKVIKSLCLKLEKNGNKFSPENVRIIIYGRIFNCESDFFDAALLQYPIYVLTNVAPCNSIGNYCNVSQKN